MNVPPDPNDRMCVDCKGFFTPWSVTPDGEPPTPPPVNYKCMTCRTKASA